MNSRPAMVAIDLGAESCRVSLLQWQGDAPAIRMVHRFANGPVPHGQSLHWDLDRICRELDPGLRQCAELAPEGIASIGVTGWAVDYVRLDPQGQPVASPYCYRDLRAARAMAEAHQRISPERLYAVTGVQIQSINTVYQLYADRLSGIPVGTPWVNLPEYILHWLGAPRVAEYTNASHTALLDTTTKGWSQEIFDALGLDAAAAPELVPPGSVLSPVRNPLRALPAFQHTRLVAPACHDTASAIAGIPAKDDSWAYISSGTWSLVGALLPAPHKTPQACRKGFTNLGAATGDILFHCGIPGMWLLRQCRNVWEETAPCSLEDLTDAAQKLPAPEYALDLDDPAFLSPGDMPARINDQLAARGIAPLSSGYEAAPVFARLIFHSLAHRYAALLRDLREMTGKPLDRICMVGGGSRNQLLNTITAQTSGLPVQRCSAESSTLGSFAIQWARIEHPNASLDAGCLGRYAGHLNQEAIGAHVD
ncbi:MAG TPA: FGGY-family carbohydrate kinase [Acidobacteriaceae bacterium]|nr:FGGY-family carbohydrate kinase [Acidobacteriaceae bacterium]